MNKIILFLMCLFMITSCGYIKNNKREKFKNDSIEKLKLDSIHMSDSLKRKEVNRVSYYYFKNYASIFMKNNTNYLNNDVTKKIGDKKFEKQIINDFDSIIKYNRFKLKNVLVNGKNVYIHLTSNEEYGDNPYVYISIVGTIDKSIDINKLKEGCYYNMIRGSFTGFVYGVTAKYITGCDFIVENDEVGIRKNDNVYYYSFGTSMWNNIILK